jgi:hypothetical protein
MSFLEHGKYGTEPRKMHNDTLEVRPDDRGNFDELVGRAANLHFEMMDDATLWISLQNGNEAGDRFTMWVHAVKGKLRVNVSDDE